jgi:Ca2+-binding RTX toxin-like protein
VHSKSTGSLVSTSKKTTVPDLSADFHTYGVDWQADKITWYFDGEPIFQAATPPDMHLPMYMQANLAVGGDWPGSPDATTKFPAELCIDYIRAWTSRPQDVQQLFTLADSGAATRTIPGSKKADNLVGTAGNDWIDGAAGADTMRGGSGDDTYIVDNAKDVVVELAGGGIETIRASVWRAILPANVENLVLTGIAGQAGTGNELNNKLVAHDRGCTLDGGLGNDILVSGNGADTLIGGRGQDIFVFDRLSTATDRVVDFADGFDMIDMRGLFASIGYKGSDPLATGHAKLLSNASGGTDFWVDADGSLGSAAAVKVVTIDNCLPS